MTRKTLLALAASVTLASAAQARDIEMCDIDSDYELHLTDQSLTWTRDKGPAAKVEMRAGKLWIDGREVALDRADRERVERIEATVREALPEVKAIAMDAVAIAFSAVEQVAHVFGSEGNTTARAEEFAKIRIVAEQRINDAFTRNAWNDDDFDAWIEDSVSKLVPIIAGDIASAAVKVALSGDEKGAAELEARAERLESTLEREVEKRADELEKRAEALCEVTNELDDVEDALAVRLDDGSRLDLFDTR